MTVKMRGWDIKFSCVDEKADKISPVGNGRGQMNRHDLSKINISIARALKIGEMHIVNINARTPQW